MREPLTLAGVGLILAATAFGLCLAWCVFALRRGRSFAFDFPGGPLRHRAGVPLEGGVALWLSILLTVAAATLAFTLGRPWLPAAVATYVDGLWYRSGELATILGLATVTLAAGMVADLFEPGWRLRLTLQLVPAVALAASGTRVTLFLTSASPTVGGLVTVLWVVVVVNAFAFLDNMDGLAAGVGVVASLLFAAAQAQAGSLFAPAVLMVVVGGLAGVLVFNRYPARLFLGYGGSWFLGFLLAAMTVAGTYYRYDGHDSRNAVLAPLLVMAVPFHESAMVVLIWLGERDQPLLHHPRHFSYRLEEIGLTPRQSARLLTLVSLGAGLGALLLRRLDAFGTAVLLGQTACLMGVVAVVEVSAIRRIRWRRSGPSGPVPAPVPAPPPDRPAGDGPDDTP